MGNRNLVKFSIYMLLLCFSGLAPYCVFAESSEEAEYAIDKILIPERLKEEMNLQGSTLKELISVEPDLIGLKQIALKTYLISEMSESAIKALRDNLGANEDLKTAQARTLSIQYSAKAVSEGWQVIRHRIDAGKAVLICGKETDGIRDKLQIVFVEPPEFSEMNLEGEIELLALGKLRKVIANSMPSFEEAQSIAERPSGSPSQEIANTILHLKALVEEQREKTPIEVYYQLAESYKQLNDYKTALEYYKTILDRADATEQMMIRAYQGMAECSERMDKPDDARIYYNLLLNDFSHRSDVVSEAYQGLEILENQHYRYSSQSEDDPISQLYKLAEYERSIDTYLELGIDCEYANPPEKQIELFTELVEKDTRPHSIKHLGLAYQRANEHEQAIMQFKRIIKEYPDSFQVAESYLNAGKSAEALGLTEEAKEYYTSLAEKFKGDHRYGVAGEKALIRMEYGDMRPTLGLGLKFTGYETTRGVPITTVFKNGPCKAAGIRSSDILAAIDLEHTPNARSVIKIIGWKKKIGDEVVLHILRGEQELNIPVTLTKVPEKFER